MLYLALADSLSVWKISRLHAKEKVLEVQVLNIHRAEVNIHRAEVNDNCRLLIVHIFVRFKVMM